MTPKEKAEELYHKYADEFNFDDTYRGYKEQSKQCALITVNEMLYTVEGLEDSVWSISATDFLKEVKQELEKI
jgi:hypothetical protein